MMNMMVTYHYDYRYGADKLEHASPLPSQENCYQPRILIETRVYIQRCSCQQAKHFRGVFKTCGYSPGKLCILCIP